MKELIQVIIVKPNMAPKVVEIENDLLSFQKEVDGYIETLEMGNDLVLIFNEEGTILGMTPNISVGYTTLVGPVIFVGKKGEEFASLTKAQMDEATNIIKEGRVWS